MYVDIHKSLQYYVISKFIDQEKYEIWKDMQGMLSGKNRLQNHM